MKENSWNSMPTWIFIFYLLIGGLWILLSDTVVESFTTNPQTLSQIQTFKGWFYVLITGLLLYWLIKKGVREIHKSTDSVRKSEERLNLALKGSEQSLWDWDLTNDKIYFDTSWPEILEYPSGELVPDFQNWKKLVHSEDLPEVMDNLNKHLDGKTDVFNSEYRIKTKHGKWKWIFDKGKVVEWDEQGNPTRILGTHKDVTYRKETELALKESQRKLSTLMDNLPGMAYRCYNDENWTMEFVSQGCEELTGYAREDLLFNKKISYAQVIHPQDRNRVWQSVKQSIAAGKPFVITYRIVTANNIVKWVWEKGNLIRADEGTSNILEGFINDITDQINTQAALEKRNSQYESFIQNSLVGIWQLEFSEPISIDIPPREIAKKILNTGYFTECNNAMARMYKLSDRNELIGKPVKDLAVEIEPSLDRIEETVRNNFKAELVDSKEKDVNGNIHYFRNSYFGYVDDGKLHWIWGVQLNITEQKQLEEQYYQAQKMEAIGNLAGGVAHDFNNLLTIINVHSELLLQNPDDKEKLNNGLNAIRKAGEKAVVVTKKLLTFSRRQIVQPKIVNINQSVEEILKLVRPLMGENILIDLKLDPSIKNVKIDPNQIEQIIMNLAVNSRDAMPNGGKLILETANQTLDPDYAKHHIGAEAGEYVMLAVSDNGTGMDEHVKAQIFEPFFTTKSKEKGSGLGLSTLYGIVKQNEGMINVYSEPDKGTTFKIYLPVIHEESKTGKAIRKEKVLQKGSETILVVEDEEEVRFLITNILEANGYSVKEISVATEAQEFCHTYPGDIHLLLTDVIMPEMNGAELAEKCREVRKDLKVLYLSGYTQNAIVDQGILKPNINFLQKPFSSATLLRKIRQVLDSEELS